MGKAETGAAGAIVAMGPNLACRIRLDSGEEVVARIPRSVARLMFRIVPGDRVRVRSSGPRHHPGKPSATLAVPWPTSWVKK